jgi:hypothetical protein
MRQSTIIFVFLFVFHIAFSQSEKTIYSGGMLLFQPGITIAENPQQQIETISFGIGGILRFYAKDHLCFGLFGGNQKAKYTSSFSKNSTISLGYGGVFFGYTNKINRFRFCTSLSLNKGRIKNMHIEKQDGTQILEGDYYSHPAWVGSPILSLDYALTEKISFTSQLICLTAFYKQNDLYFCPVLQLGVLFNR